MVVAVDAVGREVIVRVATDVVTLERVGRRVVLRESLRPRSVAGLVEVVGTLRRCLRDGHRSCCFSPTRLRLLLAASMIGVTTTESWLPCRSSLDSKLAWACNPHAAAVSVPNSSLFPSLFHFNMRN